jgi:hypothetical protein
MEQIRKIDIFQQEAGFRLPGVLYSFNIADLKRRNAHLGFRTGDKDIEELDRLLTATQSDAVLMARTQSNRWLMLTQQNENARSKAARKKSAGSRFPPKSSARSAASMRR